MEPHKIAKRAIGLKANQLLPELRQLLKFLPTGQKLVLEIGVEFGGTFFCWAQIAAPDATIVGIDYVVEPFSKQFADRHNPTQEELDLLVGPDQTAYLIKGKSQLKSTYNKADNYLSRKGGSVDLLMIDGDHSYSGVKKDFELYSPFVKKGGHIIFHDIHVTQKGFGVKKLWENLKGNKVEFHHKRGPGIGVLCL